MLLLEMHQYGISNAVCAVCNSLFPIQKHMTIIDQDDEHAYVYHNVHVTILQFQMLTRKFLVKCVENTSILNNIKSSINFS